MNEQTSRRTSITQAIGTDQGPDLKRIRARAGSPAQREASDSEAQAQQYVYYRSNIHWQSSYLRHVLLPERKQLFNPAGCTLLQLPLSQKGKHSFNQQQSRYALLACLCSHHS